MPKLTGDDKAQLLDYFTADRGRMCSVGLLVNFGRQRLEWKREFPPKEFPNPLRKNWGRQIKGNYSASCHCERSEAIFQSTLRRFAASSQKSLLAMTT